MFYRNAFQKLGDVMQSIIFFILTYPLITQGWR